MQPDKEFEYMIQDMIRTKKKRPNYTIAAVLFGIFGLSASLTVWLCYELLIIINSIKETGL